MDWLIENSWQYLPWLFLALFAFQVLRWLWRLLGRGMQRLEALPDASPKTRWQIQDGLQQALNFSAEDLESNRTFQQATLRQRLALLPPILINLGVALFWGFLIVQVLGGFSGAESGTSLWERLKDNLFFLFVLGAAVLPVLTRAGVASAELVLGRLASAEGPASKQTGRSGRRQTYQLIIDGVPAEVNQQAYEAIPENHTYRIYYFPYSKKLASLELTQMQASSAALDDDPPATQSNLV